MAFRTGHKSRAHCFSSRSLPLLLILLPHVYSLPSVAGEISGRTDICYYRYFGSSTFRLNVRNNFNVYLTAAFLSPERANSEARATKKIRICARGDRSPFFRHGPTFPHRLHLPALPTCCPHAVTEANLDNLPRSPGSSHLLSSARQTRVPYVSTKDRC